MPKFLRSHHPLGLRQLADHADLRHLREIAIGSRTARLHLVTGDLHLRKTRPLQIAQRVLLAYLGIDHLPGTFELAPTDGTGVGIERSEEHTSELKSLMRNSDAVFFFKQKIKTNIYTTAPN